MNDGRVKSGDEEVKTANMSRIICYLQNRNLFVHAFD